MKTITRRIMGSALVAAACMTGAANHAMAQDTEMMNSVSPEQRAAAAARAKDAAWKPVTTEMGVIQVGDSRKPGSLKNFCLTAEGNILACWAPEEKGAKSGPAIRLYSPKGELLKTFALDFKPGAVCVAKDGSIFAGGDGKLAKLDANGKVLASVASPTASEKVTISKEVEDMVKDQAKMLRRPVADMMADMKSSLEKRRTEVTGLTVTEKDVFMAVPAPNDFTFRVYRFSPELVEAKMVVEKLRGCCGQMDVQSHDANLWIPHNARHQVESHDRDGKELAKFGTEGRVKAADFGGCCEPKNLRVLPNGDILAAESGPPTCIKLFSSTGKFKEVIAVANDAKGDCVRVTVDMSPDGSRYYLLDTTRDAIRIFGAKK